MLDVDGTSRRGAVFVNQLSLVMPRNSRMRESFKVGRNGMCLLYSYSRLPKVASKAVGSDGSARLCTTLAQTSATSCCVASSAALNFPDSIFFREILEI